MMLLCMMRASSIQETLQVTACGEAVVCHSPVKQVPQPVNRGAQCCSLHSLLSSNTPWCLSANLSPHSLVISWLRDNALVHICDNAACSRRIHRQPDPLPWAEGAAVADTQHTLATCGVLQRVHTQQAAAADRGGQILSDAGKQSKRP